MISEKKRYEKQRKLRIYGIILRYFRKAWRQFTDRAGRRLSEGRFKGLRLPDASDIKHDADFVVRRVRHLDKDTE